MHRVRDPLVGQHVDHEVLRRLRLDAQITQSEIAERARISEHWYRRIENGYKQPSLPTARDIAKALGVTLDAICAPGSGQAGAA